MKSSMTAIGLFVFRKVLVLKCRNNVLQAGWLINSRNVALRFLEAGRPKGEVGI